MSLFRVKLDNNILVDEPLEIDKIKFQFIRDPEIRGLVLKVTSILTFVGDGYDYLLNQRKTNICESVSVQIEHRCSEGEPYVELFTGEIFVSNGENVQFNPIKCQVEAEIEDANFGSKIKNNKKIKAYVGVGVSKNEVSITPAAIKQVGGFDVTNGVPGAVGIEAYSVYECFRFLVSFMSDGELGFESNYFSTGKGKNFFILKGEELRTGNASQSPYFSFEDLFKEMFAVSNISFAIEDGNTIRIEPENDLFDNATSLQLGGITDALEYVDSETFYDRIVTGSEKVTETASPVEFPIEFKFVGWNEEEYHLLGECNGAESLSLVSEFVIDHNSIVSTAAGDDSLDDENFLFWANSTTGSAIATPLFGLGFYYNIAFTNENKVKNHFGAIPNSIALFLGEPGGADEFNAGLNSDQLFSNINNSNLTFNSVVFFNDDTPPPSDLFDPGGNFNTALFRYEAPADGVYNFGAILDLKHEITSGSLISSQVLRVDISIQRLDAAGTHIGDLATFSYDSALFKQTTQSITQQFQISTGAIPLSGGEKVRVAIAGQVTANQNNPTTRYSVLKTSRFLTLASQGALGVLETFDSSDVRNLITEFNTNITRSEYLTIRDATNKKIVVSGANNFKRSGWINDMEYTINNGDTVIKLKSNGI